MAKTGNAAFTARKIIEGHQNVGKAVQTTKEDYKRILEDYMKDHS